MPGQQVYYNDFSTPPPTTPTTQPTYAPGTWQPDIPAPWQNMPDVARSFGYDQLTGQWDPFGRNSILNPQAQNAFTPGQMDQFRREGMGNIRNDRTARLAGGAQSQQARGIAGPDLGSIFNMQEMAKERGALAKANNEMEVQGYQLGQRDRDQRVQSGQQFWNSSMQPWLDANMTGIIQGVGPNDPGLRLPPMTARVTQYVSDLRSVPRERPAVSELLNYVYYLTPQQRATNPAVFDRLYGIMNDWYSGSIDWEQAWQRISGTGY